jgi:nicotinamide-nucleotide amidase
MSIAILCIGTELMRGEIDNTNASSLARRIVALGAELATVETVADDAAVMRECLLRLGEQHELLVCTGGLGPTTDDITSRVVAQTLGVPLLRDQESEARMRERYASRGLAFTLSNLKQADFPAGATVLANDWGTAPGFRVQLGRASAFFFPGVPREMQPMFERDVVPLIQKQLSRYTAQVRLRTFGAPESKVNDLLHGVEEAFNVTVGYRVHFPEIDVKPMATRDTREEAEAAVQAAAAEIRQRLGTLVHGEGDTGLPQAVGQLLTSQGLKLGFAESCTGGLISALLSAEPCSDFFQGAVVSYANAVKIHLLGVNAGTLEREGAVSEAVAAEMAEGARRVLACDVALAVSGIAGPGGGSAERPVGLVCFAAASEQRTLTQRRVFTGDRARIQRWAAFAGFDLVRKLLGKD